MEKDISLYKEIQEPVVIFHKPVTEPHRNIPHLHSQFEFCYNIQGADGMFVDKKLYKCEGHDLLLIPQICVHRILVPKDVQYERCVINLDASFVDAVNGLPGVEGALTWLEKHRTGAPLKVRLNDADHQSFVAMVDAYRSPNQNQVSKLSVLIQLLVFLEKQFRFAKEGEVRQAESLAEQALKKTSDTSRSLSFPKSCMSIPDTFPIFSRRPTKLHPVNICSFARWQRRKNTCIWAVPAVRPVRCPDLEIIPISSGPLRRSRAILPEVWKSWILFDVIP